MKRRVNRKSLGVVLGVVCLCIISITVVYAALSTTLSISGVVDVVASTWDVHFESPSFVTSLSSGIDTDAKVVPLDLVDNQYQVELLADPGHVACLTNDCVTSFSGTTVHLLLKI